MHCINSEDFPTVILFRKFLLHMLFIAFFFFRTFQKITFFYYFCIA